MVDQSCFQIFQLYPLSSAGASAEKPWGLSLGKTYDIHICQSLQKKKKDCCACYISMHSEKYLSSPFNNQPEIIYNYFQFPVFQTNLVIKNN